MTKQKSDQLEDMFLWSSDSLTTTFNLDRRLLSNNAIWIGSITIKRFLVVFSAIKAFGTFRYIRVNISKRGCGGPTVLAERTKQRITLGWSSRWPFVGWHFCWLSGWLFTDVKLSCTKERVLRDSHVRSEESRNVEYLEEAKKGCHCRTGNEWYLIAIDEFYEKLSVVFAS